LLAEHREIIRIPNQVVSGKLKTDKPIPDSFKLGSGHVRFFIDKQLYLKNRYNELYEECLKRGYNVQNYSECWENVPTKLMNDYSPTKEDIQKIETRIRERLLEIDKV
jgi:hypothetical protein